MLYRDGKTVKILKILTFIKKPNHPSLVAKSSTSGENGGYEFSFSGSVIARL